MSKIEAALASIGREANTCFHEHLDAGTPATYLSEWLKRAGFPISATSVKDYRQKRAKHDG